MSVAIEYAVQSPPFSPIDVHFARLIEKMSGGKNPEVLLAAALLSCLRGQGHICVNLPQFCANPSSSDGFSINVRLPTVTAWIEKLRATATVGKPGEFRPLILDEKGRLYLHRYWEYEQNVAAKIQARLGTASFDERLLRAGLQKLFVHDESGTNWQKVAAFTAVTRKFCVISGGPGTGKTFTVLNILALLLEQGSGRFRIALAAPTGKAAARLQETMEKAKLTLNCPDAIKSALPTTVTTIHRLLGTIPDSPYFRRNGDDPLAVDAVVIDEASMVDLALMSKLMDALPARTRLILLGDKDQLASVEAGAVLGDICNGTKTNAFSKEYAELYHKVTGESIPVADSSKAEELSDHIVLLQKNYRFGDDSPIFALSKAIQTGNVREAKQVFCSADALSWRHLHRPFEQEFRALVISGFRPYLEAETPREALEKFNHFRILAGLRHGPFGVSSLNQEVEWILRTERLIEDSGRWYFGRPLMITQNDYNLGLFNGDVGIIAADPATGEPHAFFLGEAGEVRKIVPQRLPEHETVFAMTVHKSQGSEFDDVLMVLPETDSPVLGRELFYTAVTRARNNVSLWASEQIFDSTLTRQSQRSSGLPDLLWKTF